MNGPTLILARYYACKAVKEQWRAEGRKPQYIEPREISLHARLYLDQHPELVELPNLQCLPLCKSQAQKGRTNANRICPRQH